jgi:hypothetical protein
VRQQLLLHSGVGVVGICFVVRHRHAAGKVELLENAIITITTVAFVVAIATSEFPLLVAATVALHVRVAF